MVCDKEAADGRERRKTGGTDLKTRTPHNVVGCCGEKIKKYKKKSLNKSSPVLETDGDLGIPHFRKPPYTARPARGWTSCAARVTCP